MASVRIPEAAVVGLRKLASLSDEQFQELYAAFQSIPIQIRHHSIFDDRGIKPTTIPTADFTSIKAAVYPLFLGGSTVPVPLSEYVSDVAEAVKEKPAKEEDVEPFSDNLVTVLKDRLNKLLDISSTRIVAKAYDVLTEHGYTYNSGRVLTDVRPVFSEDAEVLPKSAVIVHMLNIDHLEGSDRKTFVVALDTKDIEELIDVLERAKKKTTSLKTIITSAGMAYVDVM
jgi:hypothetical protein